jgi:hypothetical protein
MRYLSFTILLIIAFHSCKTKDKAPESCNENPGVEGKMLSFSGKSLPSLCVGLQDSPYYGAINKKQLNADGGESCTLLS